jgi:predicted metal-dependent phosphoesterase TrpH
MHVKILDERVVARAKARGVDVLVYAPHFTRLPTIRERAERFSDDDLLVVPGRELFTGDWRSRKHVLALGLSEPVPDFLTLAGTMRELDRQDAVVIVPHPEFLTTSLSAADVREYRSTIDAVETYNPKHWPRHNRRAREIARETGLPRTASSYAHLKNTVGTAWTALQTPVDTERGLLAALRDPGDGTLPTGRRTAHRTGPRHRLWSAAEFAHLGWENSWEKVDRVLLSGTEPTHPGHVAYDGRFDDVAVYEDTSADRASSTDSPGAR